MWITPTPDTVLAALPETEVELYGSFDASGTDQVPDIVSRAVMLIRSKILACPKSIMDPTEGTIPPECEDALLAIVRHRLLARLDAEEPSREDRRSTEYRDALRYLDSVARCEALVSPGAVVSSGGGVSLVSSRTRIAKRENLSGLL